MPSIFSRFLAFAVILLATVPAYATPLSFDKDAPVQFQAKELSHDEDNQMVTAIGDVEFIQAGRILRADKMVYNLGTDTVQAMGNVSLLDEDGSVHFFEYVELTQDMKNGFVHGLLSALADGSRFTAVEARREDGKKMTMKEASYTACRVCESDPNPIWQLKADEVTHDEVNRDITYKNARLEVLGVPIAWSPVFAHADPSVERRSGFLRPDYGWTDNLGAYAEGSYYFDIAPDKDATMALRPTARKGVLVQGQWRERFKNGGIELNGSFAQSDRKEESGNVEKDQLRGHISANGLFDLNEKWRAGFDVNRASDKNYLRLYDIDESNILYNDVYAERFSGRNYSRIGVSNVQDVRLGIRPEQPDILPVAEHHMMGAPRALMGGRWSADMSAVSLQREASSQDVQRSSLELGWERRDISSRTGLTMTYNIGASGDAYAVQNNITAGGSNTEEFRGQLSAGMQAGYPLVKRLDKSSVVIEPVTGLNVSTRANNNSDVPNEDSIDVRVDPNNLFDTNRFPGFDQQEDGVRATYGMKTGVYGDDGRYAKAFVGQSYRFEDNDGMFPQGSGFERRASDVVGKMSVGSDKLSAEYQIQLDSETMAAHRHELQAGAKLNHLNLDTRYIYLDALAGSGFVEPREQWYMGGAYQINERWSLSSSTLTDFGTEPGLRRASLALNYADECFFFGAEGVRNLINDTSGESGTLLMFRVGLKNIGEFELPEIAVTSEEEEE